MAEVIERDSPVPYYEQLFDILKAAIERGDITEDERLPSEMELGRKYGLSRATVRQTLSKLEDNGYGRRVARRGVFAAVPEPSQGWIVQDTQGFLESQLQHNTNGVETVVVSAQFVTPPAHVTDALKVAEDEQVFELRRVRSLHGRVAMYSTNWFPGEVAQAVSSNQGILDGTGSVNSALRDAGFVISGARRVIGALRGSSDVVEHLKIDAGEPLLRVRSQSWDQNEQPFDYYETWVLTDVIPLEVNVSAS